MWQWLRKVLGFTEVPGTGVLRAEFPDQMSHERVLRAEFPDVSEPASGPKPGSSLRLVATVNGVRVHSDLEYEAVVNGRVTFAGGSWCDARTGEIVNLGNGTITMEGGAADGPSATRPSTSYSATSLRVGAVRASVTVEPTDGKQIVVEMIGRYAALDAIDVRLDGDTLVIAPRDTASVRSSSVSHGNTVVSRTVVRGNGNVVRNVTAGGDISIRQTTDGSTVDVEFSQGAGRAELVIRVPRGTPVDLDGIKGDVTVGDTDGRLSLRTDGMSAARVGRVRDATLRCQGSEDISVAEVNGTCSIETTRMGGVEVRAGQLSRLDVTVSGHGHVTCLGHADAATLRVNRMGGIRANAVGRAVILSEGQGNIEVAEVAGSCNICLTSMGDVTVRSGNVSALTATNDGHGTIVFDGRAERAHLSVSRMGDIRVREVGERPICHKTGMGGIHIDNWN